MGPPRSAKASTSQKSLYADSDSGEETEPDTPKPQRPNLKKRLSEAYNPDNDHSSFVSDTGRAPLKSVNINDDTAEKRRRRKSAKVVYEMEENADAGPSSDGMVGEGEEGRRGNGPPQRLASVAQIPAVNVPLDVMSSNFEEWMKMATDNKINAANSWNFALIDYFHDMSLLRNTTDNSINFQRASCTLDGCVKIWTSRVDSVGTETGKLLSNLANEGRGDDEEEGQSDNPDSQDPSQPRKKTKAHRPESTLAKNAAQLRSKKLDLEFSVDPLFKKTCADFDEGGAQGLLMNHLSLGMGSDGCLRVVFDASDSMGKAGDDEDEDTLEPEDEVDLSHLRKEFLPNLEILDERAISYSLSGFSFSKETFSFDDTTFFQDNTHHADDDDDNEPGGFGGDADGDVPMFDHDQAGAEDFFQGDQAVGDDFGTPDNFDQGDGGDHMGGENIDGPPRGGFVPFDPRRAPNERDLIMAMTDADGEGMMDYFDQTFLKNWAGPEHWKLRKVVRRPDAEQAAPKAKKEKKEAFKIDFLTPIEKDLKERTKELFAPVTRRAGINLPRTSLPKGSSSSKKGSKSKKSREREKRDDHTLPDDMHFSSRQLVTLFLKPKFSLKMRGHRARLDDTRDGDIDENFWAQAAADQAAGRGDDEEGDDTANGGAIPFNTQFFHDDDDDGPGFDDGYEGDGMGAADMEPGEQDLLAATEGQTRRVRPETVNYAKRAKRVDVRRLKENIWKGLKITVPPSNERVDKDDSMDLDDDAHLTDPSEARVFSSVISGLRNSYPKDKMDEISTSFCFICLLHLANEQGLKLEVGKDRWMEAVPEEPSEDTKIGEIWDLKVYRDPDASPAA
ncbi:hypothetical protein JAAARDRAFT_66671 [Jaapia argillacea MUCL 33604]|uniref:Condensin complex subunit 2 n=1 Tax=Jaapia argillacea MUCL 33604 TaxID=933084 RepID=A0A067Q3M7_9AGAM|nr:hypothetical protein JAAARDRAFT_66671 [Jaapia argillacea MUCL 33604]